MGTAETTVPRILVTLDGSAQDATAIAEAAKLSSGLTAQTLPTRAWRGWEVSQLAEYRHVVPRYP